MKTSRIPIALVSLAALAALCASATAGTVEEIRWTKAELTCDVVNDGFFVRSRVQDDLIDNPENPVSVLGCGIGTKALLTDKAIRKPYTYKVVSKAVPYGKQKSSGVVPGKAIKVSHKSRIRRGPFSNPVNHITSIRYFFEVPDTGAAETAVKVTAKRKAKGDQSLIENLDLTQSIVIATPDLSFIFSNLNNLDGESIIMLPPGEHNIIVNENSSYTSTGPQDSKGFQPPYSRLVKITVEVPAQ